MLLGALWFLAGCSGMGVDRSNNLIVIDAGHGGKDAGACCGGKREKDVVLQIAKALKEALEDEGYRVYMTRSSDRYLTLGQRTRMADRLHAKLFISIHANAIPERHAFEKIHGIETYFLQKAQNARSRRIAAKENASLLHNTDRLSQNVILDAVLNGPKILESNKLAIDVHKMMLKELKWRYRDVKDGGIHPAPFYVLAGASMPSILIETGYITNSKERRYLFDRSYQRRMVEGIVEGINRYLDNRKREFGF